jgi:hypothetical protein
LTLTPNPVTPLGQVTMQAFVSPASATGSVNFYQDTWNPSTGLIYATTLLGSVPLSASYASLTWTAPYSDESCPETSCALRAVYTGDATDNLSTSPSTVENIQAGTTTTTVTASPNPSTPGQTVTFTVTVSPSAAAGIVYASYGTTGLGPFTLSNGTTSFTISNLPMGSKYRHGPLQRQSFLQRELRHGDPVGAEPHYHHPDLQW